MRRCTYCFRFHPGAPVFCSHCGRSFDVRICPRGHHNHRSVRYCSECGSADLSTPAPPASFLHHLSGLVLYVLAGFTMALMAVAAVLLILRLVDWSTLTPSLLALVVMLGFLYWTTTLLPGPIRKVGKTASREVWKSVRKRDRHD